jgi:coatomer subunit beta
MDDPCTLIIYSDKGHPPNGADLKTQLQNGTLDQRVVAMKQTIQLTVGGDSPAGIAMTIFQFIMPQKEHVLKKLVLLFLEVCEKTSKDGKLLPEMILVWYHPPKPLPTPNRTHLFYFSGPLK